MYRCGRNTRADRTQRRGEDDLGQCDHRHGPDCRRSGAVGRRVRVGIACTCDQPPRHRPDVSARRAVCRAVGARQCAARCEDQAVREAMAVLERFDLLAYRHTAAAELPFGVLKRMDLARALAARPALLLLDEPTSGMSESEADRAIAAACSLAESERITLLVIEHNMRVMMALAHSVTVMQNGAVIAEGTPERIQRDAAVIDAYLGDEEADAVH